MIIHLVCYRLQVSDTFALALVAKSGSAGTNPSVAEQATFLFFFYLFLLFFFLRHYSMIPQFLLTLACFLACLAIEIINPVFSSSLHLSLVSLPLFLSLAALRTLSICKNFRYIVNCYSVFVAAKQLWEQMNAPAICVATTMTTQSRRCSGCCQVGIATGLGCTVMQPDLWQFQMQPTGLARSGLAWPGLVTAVSRPHGISLLALRNRQLGKRLPLRLQLFSILMELSLDLNKLSCFCYWLYLVTVAVVAVVFWLSFSWAAPSVSQRHREFIDNFEMFGVSFVDFKVIT